LRLRKIAAVLLCVCLSFHADRFGFVPISFLRNIFSRAAVRGALLFERCLFVSIVDYLYILPGGQDIFTDARRDNMVICAGLYVYMRFWRLLFD